MLRHVRPPGETPIGWKENENGELFSFRDIGGKPESLISIREARVMGNLLGFFHAEDPSGFMDIGTTISRTVTAGYPQLVFEAVRRTRDVVILEDSAAHPDFQSSIAKELAKLHSET